MTDTAAAMLCPVCRVPLVMSERRSVEIDYCPQCRGVWLDRGELDKIIERAAAETGPAQAPPSPPPAYPPQTGYPAAPPPHQPWGDRRGHDHRYPKRKKSFLEELFD